MNSSGLPPIGQEISDHVSAFLKRAGRDPDESDQIAEEIAGLLLATFTGQKIWFPTERKDNFRERDDRIRSLFNGKNAPVLAHQFGLSRSRIWQIVKAGPDGLTLGVIREAPL